MAINSDDQKIQMPYLAMGTYFSPPEALKAEDFSSGSQASSNRSIPTVTSGNSRTLPSIRTILPPPSPPVSPHTRIEKELGYSHGHPDTSARDPTLFPGDGSSDSTRPLFRSHEHEYQSDAVHLIDSHIREQRAAGQHTTPNPEEYGLFATFVSKTIAKFNQDRQAYYNRELAWLDIYPPRFPQKQTQKQTPKQVAGMKRRAPSGTTPIKKPRVARKAGIEKLPTIKRRVRASPRDVILHSFDQASPSIDSERKASRATPHRDDTDYAALADYSPSTSTISDSGKALKTEWRGHPLDLSSDPDRVQLHPAELNLASTLRLSCAQYLCSKRRIFASRLDSYRNGKEFRKTTAQQACKIDVNKASKLWTAFDKVGWFDPKYMAQVA